MPKRARARRQLLTSPPAPPPLVFGSDAGGVGLGQRPLAQAMVDAPSMCPVESVLSPVSRTCQKLDTLHHWSASPGPRGTGSSAAAHHVTPHPHTADPEERRVANLLAPTTGVVTGAPPSTASVLMPGHHRWRNHDEGGEGSNSGGRVRAADDFRRHIAPIRSHSGLSFAEVLARNAPGTSGVSDPSPPPIKNDFIAIQTFSRLLRQPEDLFKLRGLFFPFWIEGDWTAWWRSSSVGAS